jgi:mRNA interferase HigB
VRIISYRAIREFATAHKTAKEPLDSWYRIARKAEWNNLVEVQELYPHADLVGSCIGIQRRMVTSTGLSPGCFSGLESLYSGSPDPQGLRLKVGGKMSVSVSVQFDPKKYFAINRQDSSSNDQQRGGKNERMLAIVNRIIGKGRKECLARGERFYWIFSLP